jgi:tetratricopeptide (TPR) repeat protein
MVDKASILKNAQKFLSKGQVDKAIAEGEKLVKSFPESNSFNFLGDLYLKKGDKKKAAQSYHRTAKVFRDEGFSLKALAIYKKILNIDNSDASALLALGELNEEKNIATDAIKFYLAAADSFQKEKKKEDAVKVYTKILALAPQNIPLRAKIAETFAKQGLDTYASGEYRAIGETYEEKRDLDKAKEYFIKSLDVVPSSRLTMTALSRIAEKTGDLEQALNYIKIAIERIGDHKELILRKVHLLTAKGATAEAEGYLKKLLESEDANLDVRIAHADFIMKTGDVHKAWEHSSDVLDEMIAAERLEEAKDILDKFRPAEPIEVAKKLIIIHKNLEDNEAAFREVLALADVYKDKGMMQDAITTLNEARILQPDNTEIPEKIEAIRNLLQPEEATPTGTPGPVGAPEFEAEAGAELGKDAGVDLGAELGAELGTDAGVDLGAELGAKTGADTGVDLGAELGLDAEVKETPAAEEKIPDEAMTEVNVFLRYGLYDEAKTRLEAMKVEEPNNIDVHLKLKTLYKETNEKDMAVTECIILAELYGRANDVENRKLHIKEAYELNPTDPRLEGKLEEIGISPEKVAQTQEATAPGESLTDYQSELAEAEFYSKQGFYKEAADIYEKLLGMFPDNSEIRVKLDNVRNSIGAEVPAAETATEGTETISLDDLLAETSPPDIDTGEPALDSNVMEVFEEFKKGLEEQVSSEDTETHYNLGIAYKEMGLLDDAISTFQAAKKDPNYFVQASTMLGNCYMEKGLFSLAVEAYEGVLEKLDPNEETAWSVKYDLADALEKDGKTDEALKYFTEVYGWDSTYRQVSERVESLKKMTKAEEPVAEKPKPAKPKEPTKLDTKRKSRVSYI